MESISLQPRVKSISTVHLEWRNLRVEIKEKQSKTKVDPLIESQSKVILNNVSGYAKPGEITAIMGPSGAGKTTLLACLSNRYNSDFSGEVFANNDAYSNFNHFGGFVMQDDILMASLTVKETLFFVAALRIKSDEITKHARVDQIIKDLYLRNCQDTLVGDGVRIKGISGGERKRTSIAIELISDPNVLILDEPTSGLDSYTAFVCISLLRTLAIKQLFIISSQQRTIIFTIHQPSSDIYFLFDQLILLHQGETIYQGGAKDFINHLKTMDVGITNFQNPIDVAMRELTTGYRLQKMQTEVEDHQEINVKGYEKRSYYNSFFLEMKVLLSRAILNYVRSPNLLRARLFMSSFMAIFFSVLFWNAASEQPPQSPEPVDFIIVFQYLQNLSGTCFLCGASAIMAALNPLLTLQKNFLKEENSRLYRVSSYYLSKILIEVPMNVAISTIQWTYLYWSFGFILEFTPMAQFIVVIVSTSLVGNGLGMYQFIYLSLTGSLFNDSRRAVSLGGLIMLPLQIFGGLLVKLDSLGAYISWFQYLSVLLYFNKPFKYSLEAISRTQLENVSFTISEGNYILNPMTYYGRNFGLDNCIYILIGMAVSLHILAGISLKLQTTKISV